MNFGFIAKACALVIICVLMQIAIGRITGRLRLKSNSESRTALHKHRAEELQWIIASVIVVLLLASMSEAVWSTWRERQATGSTPRSVKQH